MGKAQVLQSIKDEGLGLTPLRGFTAAKGPNKGRLRLYFNGKDYDLGSYNTEAPAREAAAIFIEARLSKDQEAVEAAAEWYRLAFLLPASPHQLCSPLAPLPLLPSPRPHKCGSRLVD